jgi:hypothetical protein
MCTYCMKTSRSLSLKRYTGHSQTVKEPRGSACTSPPKQSKSPPPKQSKSPVDQHAPHLPNSQRAPWISMHLTSQTVKEPGGSACTSPPKQSKSPRWISIPTHLCEGMLCKNADYTPNTQHFWNTIACTKEHKLTCGITRRWISMHLTSQKWVQLQAHCTHELVYGKTLNVFH